MGILRSIFGRDRRGRQPCIALDIGARGVRGLVFAKPAENAAPPVFLKSAWSPYAGKEASTDALVIRAGDAERATKKIREAVAGNESFTEAHVGLGGEFFRSSSFRAVFERSDAGRKIDDAEFKNILAKTERASRESVLQHLPSACSEASCMRLVDSRLEEVRIDGYAVSDPMGLEGKEVEIMLHNLYTEESHLEFLQSLGRLLGAAHLYPYPSSFAVARACTAPAASGAEAGSGIFLEIREQTTGVSVVSRGIFLGTKFFSLGNGVFTKALAMHLGIGRREADELRIQYTKGQASSQASRRLSQALSRASAVWASGVELALEEFSEALELFPSSMRVWGEEAVLPDLLKALEDTDRFAKLPFLERRSAAALTPALLPFTGMAHVGSAEPAFEDADVAALCLVRMAVLGVDRRTELARLVQRAVKLANHA